MQDVRSTRTQKGFERKITNLNSCCTNCNRFYHYIYKFAIAFGWACLRVAKLNTHHCFSSCYKWNLPASISKKRIVWDFEFVSNWILQKANRETEAELSGLHLWMARHCKMPNEDDDGDDDEKRSKTVVFSLVFICFFFLSLVRTQIKCGWRRQQKELFF